MNNHYILVFGKYDDRTVLGVVPTAVEALAQQVADRLTVERLADRSISPDLAPVHVESVELFEVPETPEPSALGRLDEAIERGDERLLIEWVDDHAQSIEEARAGIARYFDAQE